MARKTVEVVQEAFPLRFKAFHVLHEPFYFDAVLAVLKPFLKDKIRRRVSEVERARAVKCVLRISPRSSIIEL